MPGPPGKPPYVHESSAKNILLTVQRALRPLARAIMISGRFVTAHNGIIDKEKPISRRTSINRTPTETTEVNNGSSLWLSRPATRLALLIS